MISDCKIPSNSFQAAEFWCIVGLRINLILLQNIISNFPLSTVFIAA